ncbi:hypothetical protein HWV62_37663 [Athelia sp. TMB]|nr:hypothetical protein HWV62_37663 [Athelia sp. TMB]
MASGTAMSFLCVYALLMAGSVSADSNGMDMSMDGAMALSSGAMLPYLHFVPGDNLWFLGWVPESAGAMVGACIGLFLLALVDRWIAACRAIMEVHWSKRAQMVEWTKEDANVIGTSKEKSSRLHRMSPQFIPAHDLSRGVLQIVQSLLGFLFMLTVMTFQVGFILAIVVGMGVGETLFGKYGSAAHLGPVQDQVDEHTMSGAPVIPAALQIYNSYVQDPIWQRRFSIVWASLAGLAILLSAPHLYRSIKRGTAFKGFFGVSENFTTKRQNGKTKEVNSRPVPSQSSSTKWVALSALGSVRLWSLPGLELNAGQIAVIIAYLILTLLCITMHAPLVDNPNRAGFLALAQLPVVFLLGTKNSILSLLLGPGHGYEKLNYIHRWSGRVMFLGAGVHGALWIRNHIQFDLPILGQQKETSGIAAFALLGVIVLTSLKPVRRWCYSVFFVLHVFSFVAFFVTVCYHTIYASPWIFPPLALYGADMLLRLLKYRIKDATLTAVDNQMTIIRIAECTDGWTAGQHLQLRVFFGGRFYESHPLTILNAPPSTSCIRPTTSTSSGEIILGARVTGDWTRALNQHTVASRDHHASLGEKAKGRGDAPAQVQVMLDGPYGGCSLDLGDYERVLLVAGGSGLTFSLGLLDDIVGRCVKGGRKGGERTKRVDVSWCVRSFGSIEWFAPMLMDIATAAQNSSIEVHISVYVTCLCDPDTISPIPNCHITVGRPSVSALIDDLMVSSAPSSSSSAVDVESKGKSGGHQEASSGSGSVAVCASGPESLTREAQNAVARVGPRRAGRLDKIVAIISACPYCNIGTFRYQMRAVQVTSNQGAGAGAFRETMPPPGRGNVAVQWASHNLLLRSFLDYNWHGWSLLWNET